MKKYKSLLLALFVMLLWGSLYPMVKVGFANYQVVGTADILLFAGIRFTICGIAICIYAALTDKASYKPATKSMFPILMAGFFSIILHYSFTYLGLGSTDSSKTALIKQIGSLFYVCFSFLFFKEDRPTARKLIAAAIGFLGIVVLNISSKGFSLAVGDVLILGASFSILFSNVISKKVSQTVSPITTTGISQLFGGIVLLIVGMCMGGNVQFRADATLLPMVYICIASSVSYCVWFSILKNGQLSSLYIIKFAEPIFACIFGAILLGENIWKIQYLAALLLICCGILITNAKTGNKTPAKK